MLCMNMNMNLKILFKILQQFYQNPFSPNLDLSKAETSNSYELCQMALEFCDAFR